MLESLDYEYVAFAVVLLVILVISFGSRARVFCQYLRFMTGIELTPREVMRVYRQHGKPGVRELFLELLIRADLEDSPTITPDSPGATPMTRLIDR